MDAQHKRNIALVGHAHCGKTTLAESILFVSGAITRKGEVMQGNSMSDFNEDEVERKISISTSFLRSKHRDYSLQVIDTPGYSDFIGETVSALQVADGAVVVVDAVGGIEVGTEDVWERIRSVGLPSIFFINKADKSEADIDAVTASLREQFSKKAVKIDLDSAELIETVAETDDKLLEKYLEQGSLSADEIQSALRRAVVEGQVFPVLTGSAIKDEGVKELLDAIIAYCPSPVEHPPFHGRIIGSSEEKDIAPSESGPFRGFVFKSIFDPHLGQLSVMRVLSGTLTANSDCYNINTSSKEHISSLCLLQGKEQVKVNEATCGDIVALPKLKNSHVSDYFSESPEQYRLDPIIFPEPSISASIKPKTRADEERISSSLNRLCEEDHTIRINRDNETNEMIISGIGDLHLKVILDRMKRRYNVDVDLGTPKICYRETITRTATARFKYKKQSGGRGQYGEVELKVAPLPGDGEELEFVNEIFGGAIPRNYIPSVEKGVRQAASEGVLADSHLINIQVTLLDGSYHEVDSSDMAFQIAGAHALRQAVKNAAPVLLEPIMEVSVTVPDDYIGQVSGDISSRRGRIMGAEAKGKNEIIKAHVPLSEMFKYATDLRSMTHGRGSYRMKFFNYEQAPAKISEQVIAQMKG